MPRELSRKRNTAPIDADNDDYDEDGDEYADDETEEAPRNTRRRRGSDDDRGERRRPRKRPGNDGSDGDAESTSGASRRRPANGGGSRDRRPARGGWDSVKKNKSRRQSGNEFKPEKEDHIYLIKFLEDGPIETWLEHFIEEKMRAKERAGFTCGECIDAECALCGMGIKVQDRAAFNIAVIDEETGDATRAWWKTTSAPLDIIEEHAHSRRNSPINREDLYFEVSKKRKGGKGPFEYKIVPLDVDEFADEYPDLDPLSDTTLAKLSEHLFSAEDVIKFDSRRTLEEVADWLDGADD